MAAAWTILVYMAVDWDQVEDAERALDAMLAADSDPAVNVVVQKMTHDEWSRFAIVDHKCQPLCDCTGAVKPGDPATLTDFLKAGVAARPADRLAVILWGHGTGVNDWAVFPKDTLRGFVRRLVKARHDARKGDAVALISWPYEDYLSNIELHDAFVAAGLTGKVALLGFDACLMSMAEVAYQLRDIAEVMVASEPEEPAAGWPFQQVLSRLVEEPGVTTRELGSRIVQEYGAWYQEKDPNADRTLAAIALGALDPLAAAVRDVTRAILADFDRYKDALRDLDVAPIYDDYADLELLMQALGVAGVATQPVLDAIGDAIIAVATVGATGRYTGLSVYFPRDASNLAVMSIYDQLQMPTFTDWGTLLEKKLEHTAIAASACPWFWRMVIELLRLRDRLAGRAALRTV